MSTTMTTETPSTDLTISALIIPAALDVPEAADFHAFVSLNNAICVSDSGLDDFARSAEEMLPHWRESADEVHLTLLAREAGEIVGAVTVSHATAEPTSAEIDLMVMPENWGRGVEQALLDAAEAEVRALGRKVIQAWTLHRPDP
ncbi:GNAT family N-acetyltransferase, partial [Bacillus tequilensis]|nr:GNAT family N-acetyltransferase [Bacillus tequilensis]